MIRIKDRLASDRPREKMAQKGVRALTDVELAMAVIGSGNAQTDVARIARKLVQVLKAGEGQVSYENLLAIGGMGPARSARMVATLELADRYRDFGTGQVLDGTEKVLPLLADIRHKRQEYFVAMTLDGANRLIKKRIISIGTLTASLVHPREVFADAIADRAAGIIVAHNHPSGNLEPSPADREVTTRLHEAGELLGITLIDHVVVTGEGWGRIG